MVNQNNIKNSFTRPFIYSITLALMAGECKDGKDGTNGKSVSSGVKFEAPLKGDTKSTKQKKSIKEAQKGNDDEGYESATNDTPEEADDEDEEADDKG